MKGGEIFIPKLPSMNITDLADAVAPGCRLRLIGIRPGEKLHETLLSADEARAAVEERDRFIVYPDPRLPMVRKIKRKHMPDDYTGYRIDNNKKRISIGQLRKACRIS